VLEQVANIDHLLGGEVGVLRSLEDDRLVAEGDAEVALVGLFDRAHLLQQGDDVVPLDVVTRRMREDLLDGGPVVAIEVLG
jgi:hypothetical protein